MGFFLSSSAVVFNDLFDMEVDKVNAPVRPLPAGDLIMREAIAWGLLTGVIAIGFAAFTHPRAFACSLVLWEWGSFIIGAGRLLVWWVI